MGAYDHMWSMDALNRMMLRSGGVPMTRIVSDNDEVNHWRHAMGNVHVQRELLGGASLRADVDYVYYHNDNPTNYVNTTTDLGSGHVARERLESGKIMPLRMWVAKVDFGDGKASGTHSTASMEERERVE